MIIKTYKRIFAAVERGELDLPAEVRDAHATLARVTAALTGLPVPRAAGDLFADAVTTTLRADDPAAVDLSMVVGHAEIRRAHDVRVRVLRRAVELAAQDVTDSIVENADTIITAHIAPAGDALWDEIMTAVKALGDVEIASADEMLRAPDRARKAYLALGDLAAQYDRLRSALGDVPAAAVQHDTGGDHATFRGGLCTVVGRGWRTTPIFPAARMPWPDDPRGRLVWFARQGHRPWWPTPAQRDEAWMEAHREQHEQQQRRNVLNRSAHAWTG